MGKLPPLDTFFVYRYKWCCYLFPKVFTYSLPQFSTFKKYKVFLNCTFFILIIRNHSINGSLRDDRIQIKFREDAKSEYSPFKSTEITLSYCFATSRRRRVFITNNINVFIFTPPFRLLFLLNTLFCILLHDVKWKQWGFR